MVLGEGAQRTLRFLLACSNCILNVGLPSFVFLDELDVLLLELSTEARRCVLGALTMSQKICAGARGSQFAKDLAESPTLAHTWL